MASKRFKLTYFNGRGRAETSRLIFAQAGVDYEDNRLNGADWPKLKEKTPFGQLPVLEVDGKVLPQSKAIARFLAKQYKLTGESDVEAAFCDAYVDTLDDCMENLAPWYKEQDAEKKKVLFNKFLEETLKPCIVRFEKLLSENVSGYLVGKNLTWADLHFVSAMDHFNAKHPECFAGQTKVTDHLKRVSNLPKIKAWIEKRPKTDF